MLIPTRHSLLSFPLHFDLTSYRSEESGREWYLHVIFSPSKVNSCALHVAWFLSVYLTSV
jgi:hypothetical protein